MIEIGRSGMDLIGLTMAEWEVSVIEKVSGELRTAVNQASVRGDMNQLSSLTSSS